MAAKKEADPTTNIASIGSMVNSAFQQSSPNSVQNVAAGDQNTYDVKQLVHEIVSAIDKLDLEDDQKAEVLAEAETIQAQLKLKKPKSFIVGACLDGIKKLIATGTSELGQELIAKIALALPYFMS